MKHIFNKCLYLVTDEKLCQHKSLYNVIIAAVKGGVNIVQLREKNITTQAFVSKAKSIKKILAPWNIPLIINDRVDVALAVQAEGVHVGQQDMPIPEVIKIMPKKAIVGLSVEKKEHVLAANAWPITYLAVSPVFLTNTKSELTHAWGIAGIAAIKSITHHPIIAIGGITLNNVLQVMSTGVQGVAIVSALCRAKDPERVAKNFWEKMDITRSIDTI